MKVLTFSEVYPTYHPKAGQATFFVEKIWNCLKKRPGRDLSKKTGTGYYCEISERNKVPLPNFTVFRDQIKGGRKEL